jgi:hypothetical protein
MKPPTTLVGASAILAAAILFLVTGCAASTATKRATPRPSTSRPAMSVRILSVKPATVTKKKATVTFHLRVKGLVFDTAHMGKANVRGHGHLQLYVDRIPGDAYARNDLKYWLASLAETTIALNLPPTLVGGPGKHRIIVALAQNDDVLYRAPVASITITAT